MSKLASPVFAAALAALLGGCTHEDGGKGGGGTVANAGKPAAALLDEGSTAMGADDWKKALPSFDAVIADAKATAEEKGIAWQNKVVCEGRLNGDDAAIATLEKLEAAKVELAAKQYALIINGLGDGDRLKAALAVIERGTEKFKSDAAAKKFFKGTAKALAAKLEAAGDTAGQDKLKSLGYLGTSSEDE